MIKKIIPCLVLFIIIVVKNTHLAIAQQDQAYTPIGVGGGGAMSGVSISPYSKLWFVGTDMGTLFRSTDNGLSWWPISHLQTTFGSELLTAVGLGFLPDSKTVFHSVHGLNPQRSIDAGLTFKPISMNLLSGEIIKYWQSDRTNPSRIFCGTTKGLLISLDKGTTWTRVKETPDEAIGTYIDQTPTSKTIYHATKFRIWASTDNGVSFKKYYISRNLRIRQFTGGRDASGLTLALLDSDGINACKWTNQHRAEWPLSRRTETQNNCGYVWINSNGTFNRTSQIAGDHLKMAENDSSTIYTTGGKKWIRQYGTKVHVSRDKGITWALKLHQLNWDVVPFQPWPSTNIEYSAIALDIGWWDDGYESFEINKLNSAIVMGSGYFFLHSSSNYGENWRAPFTKSTDQTELTPGKEWQTRGIEVVSVYKAKFHPKNSNLLYAAAADIGGMISENKAKTFRISKADHNSFYDFSFDLKNDNVVYAASGNLHDYPNEWRANELVGAGAIYRSDDRGKNWIRLTAEKSEFDRQYLTVSYDSINQIIYAGTQEKGIIVSRDKGKTWQFFNEGLPVGVKIIPQLEVNPKNGNAYALLTGNAPQFSNQDKTGIYFLDVVNKAKRWIHLRGTVVRPTEVEPTSKLWNYPTGFAVDFSEAKDQQTLWLIDYESNKSWLATGVWKSQDSGKTWNRMLQMTHPTGIVVNPKDSKIVHVSGYFSLNGAWGNGGQIHTTDGGKSWLKNQTPPLQQNARNVTLDPSDPSKIIYTYFGGGMLKGPNPAR